jgi:hypothetical protein
MFNCLLLIVLLLVDNDLEVASLLGSKESALGIKKVDFTSSHDNNLSANNLSAASLLFATENLEGASWLLTCYKGLAGLNPWPIFTRRECVLVVGFLYVVIMLIRTF